MQNLVKNIIKHSGPLSVHRFMRDVLTNPSMGYYMHRDVFGKSGDFITSPEVSQMFGELWGIWIVKEWMHQNKGQMALDVVELGPGRGSLMVDILKAVSKFPALFSKLSSVKFVEISPALRKIQENTMEKCFKTFGFSVPVEWFDSFQQIPAGNEMAVIAHEFFDALPIHQFKRDDDGKWREVLIDMVRMGDSDSDGELSFVLSEKETPATVTFNDILCQYPSSRGLEISPESLDLLEEISNRLMDSGGFALIADYGHLGEKEDTFRAFRSHKVSDPLQNIGDSDLTADVNFSLIADHLRKTFRDGNLRIYGPANQRMFLKNMGIDVRLRMLLNGCRSRSEVDSLLYGYRLMMDEKEMGDRFKFLGIFPATIKAGKSGYNIYDENYLPGGFADL